MSLNRREMIRLGAAGAGGLLLSSAVGAETLPTPGFGALGPKPAPLQPAMAAPAGIDPRLFARAKAALDSRGHLVRHRDVMGIVDFAAGSHEERFHLVDLRSGRVDSFRVAHGRGSDPAHSGFVERFSNEFGSLATSNGAYTTASTYHGKYGLSMKVRGLDWSNSNAEARAIVIHNAWYAEPDMLSQHGKLGRSEGCFAFSRVDQWQVMHRLADGRMIYADKLA